MRYVYEEILAQGDAANPRVQPSDKRGLTKQSKPINRYRPAPRPSSCHQTAYNSKQAACRAMPKPRPIAWPAIRLNTWHTPRPIWDAMVKRMKMVFKAPIDDADMPAIVDYLAKTYGSEQLK